MRSAKNVTKHDLGWPLAPSLRLAMWYSIHTCSMLFSPYKVQYINNIRKANRQVCLALYVLRQL
jgi:hypothetical protein